MSTDLQPPQDSEKKKHKKHKKHRDHEEVAVETTPKKKRRREEQTVDEEGGTVSTERKKHKKEKKEKKKNKETEELIPDSQPDVRPTKKHKRDKKEPHQTQHHPALEEDTSAPTTSPLFSESLLVTKSPFIQQTTSFYLPLSPCAFNSPLEGACAEHISPLLLTYSPILKGVVLAYENPRLSETPLEGNSSNLLPPKKRRKEKEKLDDSEQENDQADIVLAQSIDEYGVAYVWLTADFLLFRPRRGTYLEGYVNLQNESMLGLMCYNYFNAGIKREKLPQGWRWVEEGNAESLENRDEAIVGRSGLQKGGGHFVDESGKKVEGRLVFRVDDFEAVAETEAGGGTISIIGSLLPRQRREEE